ncbi:MAG: homocysteine S-methyltransferase family protein [Phycisphaerae bacterium]|nr:homocysteine S-methyltransferase family protein [Phycisphaerae bacterium]
MSQLIEKINQGQTLISDGAMGTFLQAMGLEPGQCPEKWNIDQPENVASIAKAYYDAGSDICETNSFGGTSYKIKHYFCNDTDEQINQKVTLYNQKAAEIAKSQANEKQLVFGSVGPTGQMIFPLGTEKPEQVYEAFAVQVKALAAGGADAICIETMTALEEAELALKAAKDHTTLPVIVTFTFDKGRKGYRSMMGVSVEQFVEHFTKAGADIIGSNCGNGIDNMVEICQLLKQNTDKPIMIQANAGLPVLENGKTVFKETPEDMAGKVSQLIENGAKIIGGCCGTTPEHIKAMKACTA